MRLLLRNWHLKLSAVLLATVLYTGLVFSGSFSDGTISVRIQGVNPPADSIVLSGELGLVEVTYRTPRTRSGVVNDQAFAATVDLSEYDLDRAPEPQVLDVEVTSLFEEVQIVGVAPSQVRVSIDRVEERSVPVEVDPGVVPDGLEFDEPVVSAEEVEVRGAASLVGQVDRVVALVSINPAGIDFNQAISLTPVDVRGQPIGPGLIDVDPETVSVQIDVRVTETSVTVPVRPDISGTPAPGFALVALDVDPLAVTLRGLPNALEGIDEVLTAPLSIDGVSTDQSFDTTLVLPDGLRLADSEPDAVTVTATIEPSVSSRTFVVGISCVNAGDNACLPGLEQLSVTLAGPGGALSALTAAALTPIVDAADLAPGTYELTPVLGALPDGVDLVSISPGVVQVTIVAPATPTPTPTPAP